MVSPSSELTVADHLRLDQEHLHHADWLRAIPEASPTTLGWAVTAAYYAAMSFSHLSHPAIFQDELPVNSRLETCAETALRVYPTVSANDPLAPYTPRA